MSAQLLSLQHWGKVYFIMWAHLLPSHCEICDLEWVTNFNLVFCNCKADRNLCSIPSIKRKKKVLNLIIVAQQTGNYSRRISSTMSAWFTQRDLVCKHKIKQNQVSTLAWGTQGKLTIQPLSSPPFRLQPKIRDHWIFLLYTILWFSNLLLFSVKFQKKNLKQTCLTIYLIGLFFCFILFCFAAESHHIVLQVRDSQPLSP